MKSGRTIVLSAFALIVFLCVIGFIWLQFNKDSAAVETSVKGETSHLTILWAKWKPADYLQELTEGFTEKTGVKVTVVQDSWSTWQDLFFSEMKKKDAGRFDLVLGDSQWLGQGAMNGHYVELTRWMEKKDLKGKYTDASIVGYSEFPNGSGHYWAIPFEGDALGFSYRKDLFEDTAEQINFKNVYGYPLAPPETWSQLHDIAEFFYRPESDLYGVLVWAEPAYDGLTMGVDTLVWAWGTALGDMASYRVKDILNTREGIDALEFYKKLLGLSNPEWVNHYLDTHRSSNQPMMEGQVAMAMGYFAINPELLDPDINRKYHDKIGFFAAPSGPGGRFTSLGGQGISIVAHSVKRELAFRFLEWLVQDDVQKKWAELGGLSCNKAVLYSEEFLNASPINKPFVQSMEMVRDFWAVPEYARLLKISQENWYSYLVLDELTASQAMNRVAREWETVFEENGYYAE